MYNSFWKTTEAVAVSKDFDYSEYVKMCHEERVPVLCSESYSFIRMAFNAQMAQDFRKGNDGFDKQEA